MSVNEVFLTIFTIIDNAFLPSVLFLLTSCVVCMWLGVIAGAYLNRESSRFKNTARLTPDNKQTVLDTNKSNRDDANASRISTRFISIDYQQEAISFSNESPQNVPKHVAIIMDGNRRFGREKFSDPLQGHWVGGQKLIDAVQWCMEDNIQMLTVYAFSTENWNRDSSEISALMQIIVKHAQSLKTEAIAKNIKVSVFATSLNRLPEKVLFAIKELEEASSLCTGFRLNVCFSYGSRAEIVAACQNIAADVKEGNLCVSDIDEHLFSRYLLSKDIPDPDLLIRTSGEYRLSNFLLYQMAYTEMFFVAKYWPEFTQKDFREILHRYSSRNRRFGAG